LRELYGYIIFIFIDAQEKNYGTISQKCWLAGNTKKSQNFEIK